MTPSAAPRGPVRAWQRMLSGRRLDLLDPSALDIEIDDIALGLARVARWNGQTAGEWALSVAQHSLLVESLLDRLRPEPPPAWRLLALLHDAAEYVIGDLITPAKAALSADYGVLERRIAAAVRWRFGLARLPKGAELLVKRADRAAAYVEAVRLAGFGAEEARRLFDRGGRLRAAELARIEVTPWPPGEAQARFLERFHALGGPARSR
jgi:hypothetical protein